MTFTPEQKQQLSAPLDPRNVKVPTGNYGPKGDYLEGWHVINEANRIFGFDGWSYTHSLQKVSQITNEKGNIEIAYICKCTVTVGGVVREDIGFGSGAAKKEGDAYEGAVKEAVTDALKRCLRTFGNVFGLALYDKARTNVSVPLITDEQHAAIVAAVKKSSVDMPLLIKKANIGGLSELEADRFDGLMSWLAKQKPPEPDNKQMENT